MQNPEKSINGKNKTSIADLSQLPALIELGENSSQIHLGCPCYGTKTDPQTKYLYPTPEGTCHALPKPKTISLSHQGSYCLTDQFKSCPKYNQAELVPVTNRLRSPRILMSLFLLFIAAFLLLGAWLIIETSEARILTLKNPNETRSMQPDAGRSGAGVLGKPSPTSTVSTLPTKSLPNITAGDRQAAVFTVPTNGLGQSSTPTGFPTLTETSPPTATITITQTSSAAPSATPTSTATASPTVTASATPTRLPATAVPIFTFPTRIQSQPPNSNSQPGFPGGRLPVENPSRPEATKISLNR